MSAKGHANAHTRGALQVLQSFDLDAKIKMSLDRIRAWYEFWDGDVYVAFSGGKDSTVLLWLVRSIYPNVPGVFHDTGVEFPEIRAFVRTIPNVIISRPTMTYPQVLRKYGYPVVSKRIAQYVHEVRAAKGETATKRLRLTGIRPDGSVQNWSKIPDCWQFLIDAPFEISDRCCHILKKEPGYRFEEETGLHPMIGTMASDSQQRELTWMQFGCNAFEATRPTSKPLSFWTEADVWAYIRRFNVPYSPIYDMGYTRTGCVFCGFGVHMQHPTRFQLLQKTHPKLWRAAMKMGWGEVLQYIGKRQQDLFEDMAGMKGDIE